MTAEIVEHDDVAGSERWNQALFDPGQEPRAIDGTIEHEGCAQAVAAQAGDEGQGFPVPERNLGDQTLAGPRPATKARHVGLGPVDLLRSSTINKDEPARVNLMLVLLPERAFACHVRPLLFGGVQTFF